MTDVDIADAVIAVASILALLVGASNHEHFGGERFKTIQRVIRKVRKARGNGR